MSEPTAPPSGGADVDVLIVGAGPTGLALGALVASIIVPSALVAGGPKMVSQAKRLGLPAQNCQYCHRTALPKKDAFTVDELNERSRWLVDEKTRRGAREVDVSWLKR
jgi:2-polyprenyl-6-methoxyphenol hydroxylase-like FAD-dependent oxidoreductase